MDDLFLILAKLPLPPPEAFIEDVESKLRGYIVEYGANHLTIISLILVVRGLLNSNG